MPDHRLAPPAARSGLPGITPRDWSVQPPALFEAYRATRLRSPTQPPVAIDPWLSELTGPVFGEGLVAPEDADLTRLPGRSGQAVGQRIRLVGSLLEEDGRPIPHALVEIWQANAAGRYRHRNDQHDAPIDPNFLGAGRCRTGARGEFAFVTVHPGAYPYKNHYNAWRPSHIHFSVFGSAFVSRLVTQMYFPGDPLLPLDPIFNSVPAHGRPLLVARYDHEVTVPDEALGYRFDIVLRGRRETPMEAGR
jgi:protocatechuate 3,4-dioxygenase beta subunit